ncbi:ATPase ARSA1-like [Populus alba x Populus x berolinensis]|uniref:ATPase ARSA1-like n=1 Tax=Populus alba x Populus x berolinensis TaxID=444605 RepID=A0AAD6QCA2_9ROSI|nr:ATPase ARSA1-like [Populus alba x Populus x berolinensis]
MVAGTQRKYYMLGGKGGVGKTSCAASLAVKFANSGHPTLVVSTDPAHSLSDSFAQDLTGGTLVPVEGPECPLFALEINPDKSREEFRSATQKSGGTGVKDFMEGMGLGMLVEQLGELKLGELLDTPPPGLDEAIAIAKVMQFLESPEYSMFTRIVFDTAPTGHTLRLLSLPDFLDASIGKILKLRQKITSATSAIKSVFGQEQTSQQDAAYKLEQLRERMIKVRELFRDTDATEFVIVTIPTVMAISESSRLRTSLKKENVPVKRLVVNQILPPSTTDCKFCAMKRKDQLRALDMIQNDPELSSLTLIQGPLVDVEIRGRQLLDTEEAEVSCISESPVKLRGAGWVVEALAISTVKGEKFTKMIVENDAAIARALQELSRIAAAEGSEHVPKTNGEIPSEDEQVSDHQRLLERLKLYDLVENKVQGDGNCQFRSLSDQLYDSPEHHKYVREQVIEQLKSQPQMYSSYVPMAYDDYLEKMSRSGEWGDHVTLQAAADLVWANTLLCRFPLLLSVFLSVELHVIY